MEHKFCPQCERNLPATSVNFCRCRGRKFNLNAYCKECVSEQRNEPEYKKLEKERYERRRSYKPTPKYVHHRNQQYRDDVIKALEENGHLNNRSLAERTGAPYEYISMMRNKLEGRDEIPFANKVLDEKTGKWRRRLIRKEKINLWGRTQLTYFVQCNGDGPIKIGRSDNMARRLKTLQSCCPYPLKIILTERGFEREGEHHRQFAEHRMTGEWFEPHADILQYISEQEQEDFRSKHNEMMEEHVKGWSSKEKNACQRKNYAKRHENKFGTRAERIEYQINLVEEIIEHNPIRRDQIREFEDRTGYGRSTFESMKKRLEERN